MEKQKKKSKKCKKVSYFCTSCCRWIEIKHPHTCFDYAASLAESIYTRVIALKTGSELIKRIAQRVDYGTWKTYYND